jgi:hypothetical protein
LPSSPRPDALRLAGFRRSAILILWIASAAYAEPLPLVIERLPPIDATAGPPVTYGDAPDWLLASDSPGYRVPEDVMATTVPPAPGLSEFKQGFFQKAAFTGTQIFQDGSDGLGIFEAELLAACAVPLPTIEMPLVITPSFETQFLNGPAGLDLPSQVYSAKLDLMWVPKFGSRFRGIFAVTPGWYTDGEVSAREGYRLIGRILGRYDLVEERLQLILGAIYLNRANATWIPAAGVIWKPNDDWDCDLLFPRLKIARRTAWGPDFEHWIYLAGGFGGDNWIIAAPNDGTDRLILKDWRITVGWERKLDGGAGFAVEAGYVFSRELELVSEYLVEPDNTLLVRGYIAF